MPLIQAPWAPSTSNTSSEVPDPYEYPMGYAETESSTFGGGERLRVTPYLGNLLPQYCNDGQSSGFPEFQSPAVVFSDINGEDTEQEEVPDRAVGLAHHDWRYSVQQHGHNGIYSHTWGEANGCRL